MRLAVKMTRLMNCERSCNIGCYYSLFLQDDMFNHIELLEEGEEDDDDDEDDGFGFDDEQEVIKIIL